MIRRFKRADTRHEEAIKDYMFKKTDRKIREDDDRCLLL